MRRFPADDVISAQAASPAGRRLAVKPGAIQSIHDGSQRAVLPALPQSRAFGAPAGRARRCIVASWHRAVLGSPSASRTATRQPSWAAARAITRPSPPLLPLPQTMSNAPPECGRLRPQLGVGGQPGVFHHLQIGQAVGVACTLDFLHLRSGHNAVLHNLCLPSNRGAPQLRSAPGVCRSFRASQSGRRKGCP